MLAVVAMLLGVIPVTVFAAPNKFTSDTGTSSDDGDYIGSDRKYYEYTRKHCYRIIYNENSKVWEMVENPDRALEPAEKFRMTDSNGVSNVAYTDFYIAENRTAHWSGWLQISFHSACIVSA